MSSSQSDLSNGQFGYDYVVAVTQASVNATMKEYLSGASLPEVVLIFDTDASGRPALYQGTVADFAASAGLQPGEDFFSVPNGTDASANPILQKLTKARFMAAIKAKVGIPDGCSPIPNIVTLQSDASNVLFSLIFSELVLTQMTVGYSTSWFRTAQDPTKPWLFQSKVDLRLDPVDQGTFTRLPDPVQRQVRNLGDTAFSVQQLLFDLENIGWLDPPTIPDLNHQDPAYNLLTNFFRDACVGALKQGQPVLGYAVTSGADPSTLPLTALNFQVSPYLDASNKVVPGSRMATLDYLCAVANQPLPRPANFTWNWVDGSDSNDVDGVMALKRSTLRNYIQEKLDSYVIRNCIKPKARCTQDNLFAKTVYWVGAEPNQPPKVTKPDTGETVLTYSYSDSAYDEAGADGAWGRLRFTSSFDLNVAFRANTIVVTQRLIFYLYCRGLQTPLEGNLFDTTITDTFTLKVGGFGAVEVDHGTNTNDQRVTPQTNDVLNFFTGGINELMSNFSHWATGFGARTERPIPIALVNHFVFPGGKAFDFKNLKFSDHQDLIASIRYAATT